MDNVLKFKGFANRTTWWFATIATSVATLLPQGMLEGIHSQHSTIAVVIIAILAVAMMIGLWWVQIAVYKARLNEAGWSGWWMLCPGVNIVVAGFFKRKTEENKYD